MDNLARKRIALLVGQPEEFSQALFIKGFLGEAFKLDYDVCIFAMYIKYQSNQQREIGEASIFSLIDYKSFDAVVVLADTIQTTGVMDRLEESIHEKFDGPVIFIDRDSKYFHSINTDNYNPIKKVISHLIDVHNFKDIAFLTGKKWHPHSKMRRQAYIDSLSEHGLTVDEDRIFYGDFWYTSGESLADRLLSSDHKLPDAIACANDCMALGLAKGFTSKGIRVPDDIAIVGYDTNEEGRHAPVPMTSAEVPSKELGIHALKSIDNLMNGRPIEEFESDVDLFIGGTCGCGCDSAKPEYEVRESWDTDLSAGSFFSLFNHMDEDLIGQSTFTGLITTLFSYIYHIKGYEHFSLCLNRNWDSDERDFVNNPFDDKILDVIRCGEENEGVDRVNFNDFFDRAIMDPAIGEKRDKPAAYFFMPLHFDNRVFGYSVISYGDKITTITPEYRAWLRSANRALEFQRRINSYISHGQINQDVVSKDALTGLINYKGFLYQADSFLSKVRNNGGYVGILSVDIKELSKINDTYGRAEGDNAIVVLSSLVESIFSTRNCVCFGVGNGEIVVARITSNGGDDEIIEQKDLLLAKLAEYNKTSSVNYDIQIYYGIESGTPANIEELERLVNVSISKKNGFKVSSQKVLQDKTLTEQEQKEANVVREILDDSKITYHFQPIVNASNGKIYAYEALMRSTTASAVSPLAIIRYAEFFNRLYDVEKATFNTVLKLVRENKEVFETGKKVFINSIPGHRLREEDFGVLKDAVSRFPNSVVVELTEQTEVAEDEIKKMKEDYARIGVETAVDDYGTGFSNVTNLLSYMPDYVKIDRLLLHDIQDSPQKQHFVKDIIQFSHDNGIMALAEGVENSKELETVINLGADLIQGYYTGKPSPVLVDEISASIRNEIVAFANGGNNEADVYHAGREGRINVSALEDEGIKHIHIGGEGTYQDFTIMGVPGVSTSIDILISSDYSGRITFENAEIGSMKGARPAIHIASGCDVVFVLKGTNYLKSGIKVEEGAICAFEGDGFLSVSVHGDDYYAIGNDMLSRHGDLIFNQDGMITIDAKGATGIGIGSGLGGLIDIHRGQYMFSMNGTRGVGIGSFAQDSNLNITRCAIDFDLSFREVVAIGSMSGVANLAVEHIRVKGVVSGIKAATICGSIYGANVNINIFSSYINVTVKSDEACAIGLAVGRTTNDFGVITMNYSELASKIEGSHGFVMGSMDNKTKINIVNSEVGIRLKTELDFDFGAEPDNVMISDSDIRIER